MSAEVMTEEKRDRTTRTCAGCGKRVSAEELVRVVLDPTGDEPTIVVDVSGSAFGHGAHVHPSRDCVTKACKGGFSKAFKTKVSASPETFGRQLVEGSDRRIEGLLMGARRARHLVVGADATVEALRAGKVALVIVATDAAAAAQLGEVRDAVAAGQAIAWGVKGRLGALLAREEVAVCGVVHDKVAEAIGTAFRMSRSTAWLSSEVR
jgi:predicted RNA-binding protein YlxR (DUF448 family)/ribosomal protein L7Ae-like RNA K-turn-binding protein